MQSHGGDIYNVMNRAKTFLMFAIFTLSCAIIICLFFLFMDNTSIAGAILSEDSITFIPDNGVPENVVNGPELEMRTDGVYDIFYTVSADPNDTSDLKILIGAGDITAKLNGSVLFSGTLGSADGTGGPGELSMELLVGSKNVLELSVRYTDPNNMIFPALVFLDNPSKSASVSASVTNMYAIPAGISGLSFLIMVALVLISAYYSSPDCSLAFLALGTLLFCIRRLFDTGAVECPAYLKGFVFNIMLYMLGPCALAFVILNRKKKSYMVVLVILGVVSAALTAVGAIRLALDYIPALSEARYGVLSILYSEKLEHYFGVMMSYLIVVCTVASLVYHMRSLIRLNYEKKALEEKTRTVAAGYENMVKSLKETSALRHEWKHDLLTLSILYDQGKTDEIGKYLSEKNDFIKKNEWESMTGNLAFDAILNSSADKAKAEDVSFKTFVRVPKELEIREEDLCQLLMNMLENAFNACAELTDNRFIEFRAVFKNNCLRIRCSNSTVLKKLPEKKKQREDFQNGYGIKNMQKVCRAYGSDLVIDTSEQGVFTVMTALQLKETEE